MRIVALVDSPDHVCCRYRIAAFQPHFEDSGHSLTLLPLAQGLWARSKQFRSLRNADLVILQRKLLSSVEFHLLRGAARHLLFDFDDAVWLRDSYASKGLQSRSRLTRFVRTIRGVDGIICGNSFLSDFTKRHTDPGKVIVIPTVVDPVSYPLADHYLRSNDPLRLVWIGSSSTLRGLEQMRSIFDSLAMACPQLRLRIICDRSPESWSLPIEFVPWKQETEAFETASSDVGISWIPDDDWSRGKCGLKILQYQAAGLPVLANPVGPHVELVRSGENGYLGGNAHDWLQAVGALSDARHRARLGANGREQVEQTYSVNAAVKLWMKAIMHRSNAPYSPNHAA